MKPTSSISVTFLAWCLAVMTSCGPESSKQEEPRNARGAPPEHQEQNTGGSLDTLGISVDGDAYKFNEIYQNHSVTLDLATGKAMFLSRFSTRLLFGRRVRLSTDHSVLANNQPLRYSDGSEADVLSLFMPFFGTLLAQSLKDVYVLDSTFYAPGRNVTWSVRKENKTLSSHEWSLPGTLSALVSSNAPIDRTRVFSAPYRAAGLGPSERIECELKSTIPAGTGSSADDTFAMVQGNEGVCLFDASELKSFRPGKAELRLSRQRSHVEGRVYLSSKVETAPVEVLVR